MSETVRFPFRWDPRYTRAARPFGIHAGNAWVEVGPDAIDARYGRWRCRTAFTNIRAVEVTGPYRFVKTAGPPRLGITDIGLTFASNGDRGVLLTFAERVRCIEPLGVLRHGELTVTVQDIDGFATLVRGRVGV
jgi:hypothetical protein